MEVIPAIDLRDGKCVRLYQGDYGRETIYSEDPLDVAGQWVAKGARRLHVVDLDGAKRGAPENLGVVEAIASRTSVPVQFGGGVRTVETAKLMVSLGVDRVMVGTAAVESPGVIEEMCAAIRCESMVVSLDARDGDVAVKGWTQGSRISAVELAKRVAKAGVYRFLYTDIGRDGTLTQPNFCAVARLLAETGARIIAAGGISSVSHLLQLAEIGVEAAVVGKALYTGHIDLGEALKAVGQASANNT